MCQTAGVKPSQHPPVIKKYLTTDMRVRELVCEVATLCFYTVRACLKLEVLHEADVKLHVCFHASLNGTQLQQVYWVSLLQRVVSPLGEAGKCYYLSFYGQLLQHKVNKTQTLRGTLLDSK